MANSNASTNEYVGNEKRDSLLALAAKHFEGLSQQRFEVLPPGINFDALNTASFEGSCFSEIATVVNAKVPTVLTSVRSVVEELHLQLYLDKFCSESTLTGAQIAAVLWYAAT